MKTCNLGWTLQSQKDARFCLNLSCAAACRSVQCINTVVAAMGDHKQE